MKTLLPTIIASLALFSPLHATSTNPILDAAAQLSEALASDSFSEAKADASKLASAAMETHDSVIAQSASKVAIATSLEQAREDYKAVGAQTALLAHGVSGYSVVSCSMANGKWVQKGTAIRNPYFGSGMLTCGVIE